MSALPRARTTANPLVVGVVGAGRVGAVLGAALTAAGHHVVAAAAVSAASRRRAARLLPTADIRPVDEVARAAIDLLLLAVPDDALAAVVAGLATTGALRPGQVVAHTSGAHGLAVLGAVHGMALHPAMTFTGTADDLDRLPGIAWGVTARDRAFATRLVADLGGVPEWIDEDARPVYHAALAHGANHLVTLVNEAADLLRTAGVDRPERVLSPLLHAALDNALRFGDAALTGPVSRGDAGTVGKHLDRMPAEAVPAYLALARRTADRAIAAGRLRPQDAALLMDVLSRATVGEPLMTVVVHTRTELASRLAAAPEPSAVVMTMGALHEGHRQLMRVARRSNALVIATIFVNPLQFGPNEDYERYPRTLDADVEACRAEGVDLVFAPDRAEMYPDGAPQVTMHPGQLGDILEGASRPGHFAGMLTVVQKLLLLTQARRAYFGEKDFQQLTLIRRMVYDLELGVDIVGVPTVRETDGLALSSRNRYLSPAQRRSALVLSQALREGAAHVDAESALRAAGKMLDEEPGVQVDYLALTGPDLGEPPAAGPARLLVAAKVGATRLIDNVPLRLEK